MIMNTRSDRKSTMGVNCGMTKHLFKQYIGCMAGPRAALPAPKRAGLMRLLAVLMASLFFVPVFASCAKKSDVSGAWHNEEYAQAFTFNGDGTYTLKTAAGEFTGIYVFDADTGEGTISVLGEDLPFTVEEDKLILGSEDDVQVEFERGDMAIAVVTLTPAASAAPIPTASEDPTPTPTGEATATPPESAMMSMLPLVSIRPDVYLNPDLIAYLLNAEILGVWVDISNPDLTLEFKSDGTFEYVYDGSLYYGGTFTYNPDENEGVMTRGSGHEDPFSYNEADIRIFAVFTAYTRSFKKAP